jgi:hypothetical protein
MLASDHRSLMTDHRIRPLSGRKRGEDGGVPPMRPDFRPLISRCPIKKPQALGTEAPRANEVLIKDNPERR